MVQLVGLEQRLQRLAELLTGGAPLDPTLRPETGVGPIRLVIVQPTPFCNLDCAYCYLPQRSDRRRMEFGTVEAIGRNLLSDPLCAERVSVVWHGGEPMTLPPSWYDEAFSLLAEAAPGRRIDHGFQTNGVGVNDAWIDLWRRWDVRLGVSLDGPAAIHDAKRVTRAGKGSHALTMRGVSALQASGLRFHVICVLTAASLAEPDAVMDFFLRHDLRDVCFNVEEEEGAHRESSLRSKGVEQLYRRFLDRVATRVLREGEDFTCREIEGVRGLIALDAPAREANPQTRPLAIVSVGVDGAMSTYSPEFLGVEAPRYADFRFADVRSEGPRAILRHPGFKRLRADVDAGVEACRARCGYFGVCGGGAPANKHFELGDCRGTETLFCRLTRQAGLEAVLDVLERDELVA